jgi:glycosyltransferase involved in cell wall biosynthesis
VDELRILVELLSSDLRMGAVNDSLDLATYAKPLGLAFTFCGRLDDAFAAEAGRRGARTARGRSVMLSKADAARYAASVLAWAARLVALRPHIVHLDYAGWAPSLALAARIRGIPIVGRAGGQYDLRNKANGWIDAYVANCEPHAGSLLASPLAPKVTVTGSLFRVDRLTPPFERIGLLPPRSAGCVRFLFLGQLVERKGIDTLVQAFSSVRSEADLLLAGGDWSSDGFPKYVRDLIEQQQLVERVHLVNHRSDAPALLNDCDVFVLPSRSDARPRSIIEAMYLGKPVVASSVGGIPTLIDHGVTGLLVPPSDPAALGAALETLASDSALRARLGSAASDWARREVQPEKAARLHAELYRSLVARRSRAR